MQGLPAASRDALEADVKLLAGQPVPSKLQNYLVRINKMTPSNITIAMVSTPAARRTRCCLGCLSDNKTSSWAETKLKSAFL